MKPLFYLIIAILITSQSNALFAETESIEHYLPYDTVLYADILLDKYQAIHTVLKKILSPEEYQKLLSRISAMSLKKFDIDVTDPDQLTKNGFDLSHRIYFSLFDFVLSKDFRPIFTVAIQLSDVELAKNFIDMIINQWISEPIYETQNYKGYSITIINKEVTVNTPKNANPFNLGLEQKSTMLYSKLYHIVSSQVDKIMVESFAYAFIDNYFFIGTPTAIKKIIDCKYFRESLQNQKEFTKTIKLINQKGFIRAYISLKQLSPLFLSHVFESNYGLALSLSISDQNIELLTASRLNPDSSSYYQTKQLYPIPKSPFFLDYLPTGDFDLINWQMNLRAGINELPWYSDLYYVYTMGLLGVLTYNTKIDNYSYKQESLEKLLQANSLDLIKDFINNIGNDFYFITLHPNGKNYLELNKLDVLLFTETNSKVNGYKLLNKILSIFRQAHNELEIEEEKISGHYFYTVEWDSYKLYFGLYQNRMMMASQGETLKKLIKNIENNQKALAKSFRDPIVLKYLHRSYFNFFYSFDFDSQFLTSMMLIHPKFGFVSKLDYFTINSFRQGDVFYDRFLLRFK